MKKQLDPNEQEELLELVRTRFENNMNRHKKAKWESVLAKLKSDPAKLWSLHQMEITGGEPDLVSLGKEQGEHLFVDCSKESPKGRRSVCYDQAALESRKKHKPDHSALGMAEDMGVELLTQEEYINLQKFGEFDTTTSSWVITPDDIRKKGGAIFGDFRYGKVFIYHNGADSYYGARGFRACLRV